MIHHLCKLIFFIYSFILQTNNLIQIMSGSWELPIGSSIEFLQKDSIPIADVSQIHEASVNVPDVTDFLIPEELVVVLFILCVYGVVLTRGIFFLRFVLNNLLSWGFEVVSFFLHLFVCLMVPKVIKKITISNRRISYTTMDASTSHRLRVFFMDGIEALVTWSFQIIQHLCLWICTLRSSHP